MWRLLIIVGVAGLGQQRNYRHREVSEETDVPLSLLSNRALGPVLHGLIQMRVPHTGLAEPPPLFLLTHTHSHTVAIWSSFTAASYSLSPLLCLFYIYIVLLVASGRTL